MPLEPATQAIVDQMAAAGTVDFAALDADSFRRLFRDSLGALDHAAPPADVSSVDNETIPGPGGPIRIRVYRPRAEEAVPVVTYFHGGGWVIGDIDTHDGTCRTLCHRTGAVVVSVDYRLAPEHRFPAALDDCEAATAWVADHARHLGGDPERLAVAGDSAGGNLAAAVTLRARERGGPALRAQALVYPAVDFTTERPSVRSNGEGYLLTAAAMRWFCAQYLGDHDPGDPMASPLLADLAAGPALPPAVVAIAEFDPLRDEGRAYAEGLAGAGVPVHLLEFPGLVHGFMGLGALSPASARATDEVWAAFAGLLTG
ncbi:MAG TPA: alpha/beta hydrolase [Acidimicrobiales bacterium]|nr:alpha/beta hydrolase [Acidimicrobiales bacterium]